MRNFQDAFETRKRLFVSAFSICMTVPLNRPRPRQAHSIKCVSV